MDIKQEPEIEILDYNYDGNESNTTYKISELNIKTEHGIDENFEESNRIHEEETLEDVKPFNDLLGNDDRKYQKILNKTILNNNKNLKIIEIQKRQLERLARKRKRNYVHNASIIRLLKLKIKNLEKENQIIKNLNKQDC